MTFETHTNILSVSKINIFKVSEDYQEKLHSQPNIFCHFAEGTNEPKYLPVKKFEILQHTLVEALENYNDILPAMQLVLFQDAITHVYVLSIILLSISNFYKHKTVYNCLYVHFLSFTSLAANRLFQKKNFMVRYLL